MIKMLLTPLRASATHSANSIMTRVSIQKFHYRISIRSNFGRHQVSQHQESQIETAPWLP